MASSITGICGVIADAQLVNAKAEQMAGVSLSSAIGGATTLSARGGIRPTGGSPLAVAAQGTPALSIQINAGSVIVPPASANEGPMMATLGTASTIDGFSAGHATLVRVDQIIAEITVNGASSTCAFKLKTGTAGSGRGTLTNTGTTRQISLATITVPAAATTITNAMISIAQSDTWTLDTSDAGYTVSPGGTVPVNYTSPTLLGMTATRRQAWAALYPAGTRWVDLQSKVEGFTNGTDIVPTSTRTLYEVADSAVVSTSSATPVTSANSGTLTVFGGSRRIRVTARGHLTCDGSSDLGWVSSRAYLDGTGVTGILGQRTEWQARLWGHASNPGAFSRNSFTITASFTTSSTSISIQLKLLREGSGGTSPGVNSYLDKGYLLVEDIGPA